MADIMREGSSEMKGEEARMSSFVGALAIVDLIKTTLGPKGMDKILVSQGGGINVTNDGATILRSIVVDNPAAKVLIDISRVQDDEVGDGTTSVCCFAGELLRNAEVLMNQRIHPQTIVHGWRMASETALKALEASAVDNSADPEKFREDLMNIARTTLSSKLLCYEKEHFANLAVDAVLRLKGSTDLDHIQIIKKSGGTLKDSYLDEGFILDNKFGVGQPTDIKDAKILVANTAMDTDKVKIYGARVRVEGMAQVAEIEAAEKQRMVAKCDRIVAHGCNIFVNRQLIYNLPEQHFAEKGISSIEHADFAGIERLALVTGADIVSTFDTPDKVNLGRAAHVSEVMIGEDKLIKFSGCTKNEACTVVLRGANMAVLDEAERSLHDALCVLSQTVKETRTVLGGGCSESLMANAVDELAKKTPGKKSLAIEAYAKALRGLPTILADNAGYDSTDLVAELRSAHHAGKSTMGINMDVGRVDDVKVLGITESYKLKKQVVTAATEAAEMVVRVDIIEKSAPRQRQQG